LSAKPKIGLFLSALPHYGGAFQFSQSVLEAIASLPPERFERVAVFTDTVWSGRLSAHSIPGLALHSSILKLLSFKRIAGWLPVRWWRTALIGHLRSTRTLLSEHCGLWVFPAQETYAYLMPVPSLGVIFDLMHRYERQFPEVSSKGVYHIRERHYRKTCRHSRGVLVDSEVGKRHVLESYPIAAGKVHVLPFVPPQHIHDPVSEGIFPDLPSKFIFYPAQFWEHKNHKRLVQASAFVRKKCPDFNLVFVGSRKNAYDSTVESVRALELSGNIHFLGYVPDSQMPALYRKARAMIMPTFFGPTNIPPLEAIAVGCPVAVSNIYGMPHQLGDAALYFNPTSVDEMAAAMDALWTDDRLCDRLRTRGLRRASEWTQGHFNLRFQEIIENILQPTPRETR
jgi:glycosyltransferase involved in cell wall biosynthesis